MMNQKSAIFHPDIHQHVRCRTRCSVMVAPVDLVKGQVSVIRITNKVASVARNGAGFARFRQLKAEPSASLKRIRDSRSLLRDEIFVERRSLQSGQSARIDGSGY
jgi:hypothetical protein